jgi:hypothetical protein
MFSVLNKSVRPCSKTTKKNEKYLDFMLVPHIHALIHLHTCIHAYTKVLRVSPSHTHTYMYTNPTVMHTHTHTHTRMHTCIHTWSSCQSVISRYPTRAHISRASWGPGLARHSCMCVCMYKYVYIYMHICTWIGRRTSGNPALSCPVCMRHREYMSWPGGLTWTHTQHRRQIEWKKCQVERYLHRSIHTYIHACMHTYRISSKISSRKLTKRNVKLDLQNIYTQPWTYPAFPVHLARPVFPIFLIPPAKKNVS